MSQIVLDSGVAGNRKTLMLISRMGWAELEAVGRLTLFFGWCADQAEDGDLRRFNDSVLAAAAKLPATHGKKFIDALVDISFLERRPYFRIRNWWDWQGVVLREKYKREPAAWHRIRDLY